MRKSNSALILFTLSPEAEGKRKPLGFARPEHAAAVYRALLRHLEAVCSNLPGVDLLVNTPGKPIAQGAGHLSQRGSSFGDSLRLAVEDAFGLGYERVVVIGNDAPEISRGYLQKAFAELGARESRASVIGPARDGGYALLGLNKPCPDAFESIPWGSRRVARMTEERLERSGFSVARLATLDDIDNRLSLSRFLTGAPGGDLAELAKEIATLLSTNLPRNAPRFGSFTENLLSGWCPLRAPPPQAYLA